MNEKPLFSILIANYNNGKYLMEAIDSVRQQTYPHWEIILVDDDSTDNSQELYKELEKDHRIHIYHNQKNEGCGYTKHRCTELGNGEICGFLDPDDILLPNALQSHVKAHTYHENCSCVFSRYYLCDERMNIIGQLRRLAIPTGYSYLTHHDYSPEHFVSFKRSHYFQTEGIATDIKQGVDQDLYFKLEEIAPIYILDEFTYKYRMHTNNISHYDSPETIFWNLLVRQRACDRRGINPSDIVLQDFVDTCNDWFQEGVKEVRSSYPYRVGKLFLSPFSWIKKHRKNQR